MNESVSSVEGDSDDELESIQDGNDVVSNEEGDAGGSQTLAYMSEESDGEADADFEDVEGFDIALAMSEGQEEEEVEVTAELEELVEAGREEFGQPESVCGTDNRIRITSVTRTPWRRNCQLIITKADGKKTYCTGWFIGPHTVMTAGHCVYSHAAGGWARKIEVIPGMDGSRRPYGSQTSTSFRSVRGWTRSGNPEYDYGAIILPNDNLGNRIGWYGFAALSTSSLSNLHVNNSGYPADKPFGTQWYNAGRITRVTSRRLYYMIDTYGGQSGSIVYRYRNGARHAVGIHGYGGCPNKAVRITRPVFDNMKAWKA